MARSPKSRTVAAIFGSVLALAIGGCGGSQEDIPRQSANELLGLIDSIRSAVDDDRCEDAESGASDLASAVNDLVNEDVPDDVVTSLQQGTTSLQSLIAERCGIEAQTTTTTAEATETTTTAEATETTTTADTTTTTTTATTEPEDDDDGEGEDEDTGGTGAGGTEAPGGGGGGGATPRIPGVDGPAGGSG